VNTRTRVSLQQGYVLHHWPYRDTSLLVEILTRDHGRIGLVARGAKRSKSRLYGVLQPFIPLIVSWSGKGDLGTLTTAEAQGPVTWLCGRAMMNGFYINELLLRLLHRHDPHPDLFDEYTRVLRRLSEIAEGTASKLPEDLLNETSFREQWALRIFEKNMLRELGYGLVLDHDVVTGQPVTKDGYYAYYLDRGPILRPEKASLSENLNGRDIRDSQYGNECVMLHGNSLVSLAQDNLTDALSLQESKRLMRTILKKYLGDKPLGSRQLFHNFVYTKITQDQDTLNT